MHAPRTRTLLDGPSRGAASSAGDTLATVVGGESVTLFADRALYWPQQRTLFVADVHLGKAATFRANGVPLPRGVTATDLGRLTALVARSGATRIVVLGDFLHAKAGRVAALDNAVTTWRATHRALDILLIRGNHDARAGDPPPAWGIECRTAPFALPPFLACHEPADPRSGYALCGHIHPGVRLHGRGEESACVPCFVLRARCAILPAFGRFTGLATVTPSPRERVVAIAGASLFSLPQAT